MHGQFFRQQFNEYNNIETIKGERDTNGGHI